MRFGQANVVRNLAAQEILFCAGDFKSYFYRVDSGVICLYDGRLNGEKALVEFIFPGDYVGLGFLETHTLTARAMVETRITCLPVSDTAAIAAGDKRAEEKLAESIEREFDARRMSLSSAGKNRPTERVAALLVNLSCSNRYEGRDPHLLSDSWECGTIADMLDLSIEDLAGILIDLERRKLIEVDGRGGLRLIDIDALEDLADGSGPVRSARKITHPPRWPVAA